MIEVDKWDWGSTATPDSSDIKMMWANALRIGIKSVFNKHFYEYNGEIYIQGDRGPIGLTLTGAVARLVLIWWDIQFKKKLALIGITLYMLKRYIDDINCIAKSISID